jgi:hypothetical protein
MHHSLTGLWFTILHNIRSSLMLIMDNGVALYETDQLSSARKSSSHSQNLFPFTSTSTLILLSHLCFYLQSDHFPRRFSLHSQYKLQSCCYVISSSALSSLFSEIFHLGLCFQILFVIYVLSLGKRYLTTQNNYFNILTSDDM